MRVIVTGSRDWADEKAIRDAFEALPAGEQHTIVHGGARGADALAGKVARSLGFEVEIHPADWSRYGRSAGPKRNRKMASLGADLVLAFPLPSSIGTLDMIEVSRSAGIPVRVVEPGRD